jgi:hypothetical protein
MPLSSRDAVRYWDWESAMGQVKSWRKLISLRVSGTWCDAFRMGGSRLMVMWRHSRADRARIAGSETSCVRRATPPFRATESLPPGASWAATGATCSRNVRCCSQRVSSYPVGVSETSRKDAGGKHHPANLDPQSDNTHCKSNNLRIFQCVRRSVRHCNPAERDLV